MKVLVIVLLMTTYLSYGQVAYMDCLDLDSKLGLFIPQIRKGSKVKTITDVRNYFPDSIYIKVNFSKIVRYDNDFKGIAIEVINTTNKEFTFENSGFQDFFCQVKLNGSWVSIETKPDLWADKSQELIIPPYCYVTAILPCYRGTETVIMRYRFAVNKLILYSEEFEGSINPELLK